MYIVKINIPRERLPAGYPCADGVIDRGGREDISPAILDAHSMRAARRCHLTDRELRGLSRRDLLELLVAKEKENQQLRQELEQARAELNKRQIDVAKTGTMAEAALLLNGIFDAADRAARQYLENIRLRAEGTNK